MEVLELAVHTSLKTEREKRFEELYEVAFPAVAAFVSKMNGSFQDAKDIFQDALVIYFEKSTDPKFRIASLPERYILGIAKHLWIGKFKEDRKKISLDTLESTISIPADFFPSIHSIKILQFLENTGKKCMDLLRGFYYEKLTMKEMTRSLGYSNEHSVTVQKYKCLEKIRESIKEKSIRYEDFFE